MIPAEFFTASPNSTLLDQGFSVEEWVIRAIRQTKPKTVNAIKMTSLAVRERRFFGIFEMLLGRLGLLFVSKAIYTL